MNEGRQDKQLSYSMAVIHLVGLFCLFGHLFCFWGYTLDFLHTLFEEVSLSAVIHVHYLLYSFYFCILSFVD